MEPFIQVCEEDGEDGKKWFGTVIIRQTPIAAVTGTSRAETNEKLVKALADRIQLTFDTLLFAKDLNKRD